MTRKEGTDSRARRVLVGLGGLCIFAALAHYIYRDISGALLPYRQVRIIVPCSKEDPGRRVYSTPPGRLCLEKNTSDLIKDQMKRQVPWEPHVIEALRRHVRPGSLAVEAGAYIGTHTLLLSRLVGERGRVVAFEPQFKIYQELLVNLDLNRVHNVRAEMAALGDRGGRVTMSWARDNNEGATALGTGGNRVELRTLDSYRLTDVGLIKIDVEGFELPVLQGADRTIRQGLPVLILEVSGGDDPVSLAGGNAARVLGWLKERGYRASPLEGYDYIALPPQGTTSRPAATAPEQPRPR